MSILNIPTAVGNVLSSLSSHIGHKKGHGGGGINPLDSATSSTASSATSSTSASQPSSSTQSMFGTLLDSVEQVAGIQMTANKPNMAAAQLSASSLNAGLITPASIAAAQAALKKT
jgi:hypothetical protein